MATPTDFSEYYKTISNTELISILENPGDYQASAIEAAKKELSVRQLSDTAINEAKESVVAGRLQKEKQKEKVKAVEDKVKDTFHTIIDTINPVQAEIPTTERIIRLILVFFSGIFLYKLITEFRDILAYIKDIPRFPFACFLYLFPFVIMPVAIITFWKRKTVGWVLLAFFVVFSALNIILLLIWTLTRKHPTTTFFIELFPEPSPATYILPLLFWTGATYTLCKSTIREVFKITNQKMMITLVVSGFITIFLFLMI